MGALSAFYLFLGWRVSKGMHTHTDFFLAGKSLGPLAITATLLAAQIGGGTLLGTAQDPFKGIMYVLGIVTGFFILGLGIAEKFRAFEVETIGDIFSKYYKSSSLKVVSILLAVFTLCGILLSQAVAAKSVIAYFTGTEGSFFFILFWAVILVYTILGGLKAVAIVDEIQIALIIIIFTALFFYDLFIAPHPLRLGQIKELYTNATFGYPEMLRIFTITALHSIITQDVVTRFFAAKNKKSAGIAALCAGVGLLSFAAIPFYFGAQAYMVYGTTKNPLFSMLGTIVSGVPLSLVACALLAALSSTIDALLCTVSSLLYSLLRKIFPKTETNARGPQLITFLCGGIILIGSFYVPDSIIGILVNSYELSVATLLIPVLMCCFRKERDLYKVSAFLSISCGFAGFVAEKLHLIPSWLAPWMIFINLGLGLGGYLVGDLLYRKNYTSC